jgi:hypothetical protein
MINDAEFYEVDLSKVESVADVVKLFQMMQAIQVTGEDAKRIGAEHLLKG